MPHSRASYLVISDASNLTAHRSPNLTECSSPAQQLLCRAPVFLLLTESLTVLPHLLTTYQFFKAQSSLFPQCLPCFFLRTSRCGLHLYCAFVLCSCPRLPTKLPEGSRSVLCYSVLLRNLSQLLSDTRLSLNRYYPEMKKKMPHVGHVRQQLTVFCC